LDINCRTEQIRTLDIVDELAEKAKLDKNELYPVVQSVFLGNNLAADDLKLMEIDEEKLNYLLEGNDLIIRGDNNENAVCCSNNSTFSFKVAEISNPLLITSNLIFPSKSELGDSETVERSLSRAEVLLMSNSYFELVKEKPKMQKLRNLLEMNLFCGKAIDKNSDANKYTIRDLLDQIQSSEDEIYTYLKYIEAYKIDGYWRLLDQKFYSELMDNILKLIEERSWECDKIPIKEVYDSLKGVYGLSILNQVVQYYFHSSPDNHLIYKLNKNKACHFYAENLLKSAVKMRYGEFCNILNKLFPSNFDFEFSLSIVQDICYVEDIYVYYLNTLDLPDTIDKRFKFLFDKRKKWNYDELSALIGDLCSNNSTEINNALMKYCRPFTQNSIKYFTSRMC
jgi:hypothetical protein